MANGDYVDTILGELGKLKPTKLIHISDTHFPIKLRVGGRLDEYQKVIQNTLKEIDRISQENTAICVLTGDIMHDKDRLDPDGVLMAREFMINLGRICSRVIVIAGNHDVNEANPEHSTDAIEPICFATPNIEYLKNSGLYRLETLEYEIIFVVSSLLDKKFITYEDARKSSNKRINVMKELRYIKVYHGAICGARTGKYVIEKKHSSCSTRFRSLEEFKGYDLVLLGDIHEHQFLDKKKTIAYAGSLIQQNFGESIDKHGILIWSVENTQITAEFVEIYNPYCYMKLDVDEKGEIKEKSQTLLQNNQNKNLRLKILTGRKMSQPEKTTFEKNLNMRCLNIDSITYQYESRAYQGNSNQNSMQRPIFDTLSKEIELITEWYYKQNSPDGKILEKMIELHKNLHTKYKEERVMISSWCLRKLEFKNILVYGGNIKNSVDFETGVYSISAPNAAGKSSIIEIILIGLFDGGITNKSNVISFGQSEGYIRTEFIANNVPYEVTLTLTKSQGEVKKKCTFYKKNGTDVQDLTTSIPTTYKIIKSIIGDDNYFRENNVLSTRYQPHLLNIENAQRLARLNKVFNMEKYECYQKDRKTKDRKKELDIALTKVRAEIGFCSAEIKSFKKEQSETVLKTTRDKIGNLERDIERKTTEIKKIQAKINETFFKMGAVNVANAHGCPQNLTKEQIESRMSEIKSKYYSKIKEYDENSLDLEIRKIESSLSSFSNLRLKLIQAEIRNLKQQSNCHRENMRRNLEEKPFCETKSGYVHFSATQDLNALALDDLEQQNTRLMAIRQSTIREADELFETCEDVSKLADIDKNTFQKYKISVCKYKTLPPHLRSQEILQIIHDEKYTTIPEKIISIDELLAWFKKQQPPVKIGREKHTEIINTLEYHEHYQAKLKLQEKIKHVDDCIVKISDNEKKQNEIGEALKFFALKKKWLEEKSKLDNTYEETEFKLAQLEKLEEFYEMREYYVYEKKVRHLLYNKEYNHLNKQTEKLEKEIKTLEADKTRCLTKLNKAFTEFEKYNKYTSKISELRKVEESTQAELNVYKNYMELFHRDKIPLIMLKSMLSDFTRNVNAIFENHTKYSFSHELNNKTEKLEFTVTDRTTKNKLPTNLLSGFESIILKMAINKACSEMSSHSHSRLFCVDEALDCLDNQKFDTDLPRIINAMTQEYQVVLIISHRDLPNKILSKNIKITIKGKYSIIDSG